MKKLYVNLKKPTSVVNNITFNEGKSYLAFSDMTPGLTPYIHFNDYNLLLVTLKRIANENLSAVDCEKVAKLAIEGVGE
jgi:hypothetical protein